MIKKRPAGGACAFAVLMFVPLLVPLKVSATTINVGQTVTPDAYAGSPSCPSFTGSGSVVNATSGYSVKSLVCGEGSLYLLGFDVTDTGSASILNFNIDVSGIFAAEVFYATGASSLPTLTTTGSAPISATRISTGISFTLPALLNGQTSADLIIRLDSSSFSTNGGAVTAGDANGARQSLTAPTGTGVSTTATPEPSLAGMAFAGVVLIVSRSRSKRIR